MNPVIHLSAEESLGEVSERKFIMYTDDGDDDDDETFSEPPASWNCEKEKNITFWESNVRVCSVCLLISLLFPLLVCKRARFTLFTIR